jgi:hypothetical protein
VNNEMRDEATKTMPFDAIFHAGESLRKKYAAILFLLVFGAGQLVEKWMWKNILLPAAVTKRTNQ